MEKLISMTLNDILKYEVHSNWLTPYVFFGWGQDMLGWYIGKKVNRKYKRYLRSIEIRNQFIKNLT